MLYREIIAVCSEVHTKHTNMLCGQNVVFLMLKLAVRVVSTRIWVVNADFNINILLFKL
jgi:hypothetical protein